MGKVQVIVEGMTASGKPTVVNLLSGRLGLQVMPEEFRTSTTFSGGSTTSGGGRFPCR